MFRIPLFVQLVCITTNNNTSLSRKLANIT